MSATPEQIAAELGGMFMRLATETEDDAAMRRIETARAAAALIRAQAERVRVLEALIPLAKFGDAVMNNWPEGSIDGFELQDMLKEFGLIAAVEGGFNENIHIDAHNCCPEPGDEWLLPTQAALDAVAALKAAP